jgi:hypothetical protein
MHPDILQQLAAGHIRDLVTDTSEARRAHEAHRARRHRTSARPRRSTPAMTANPARAMEPAPGPPRNRDAITQQQITTSGCTSRSADAPVTDFEAIAPRYPVFRAVRACDPDDPLAAGRPAATPIKNTDQGE